MTGLWQRPLAQWSKMTALPDKKYLLLPFSPILVLVCLFVFLYERFILNDQERVEDPYAATIALLQIWNFVVVIVTFPVFCLGPIGGFIRLLVNAAFLAPQVFLKTFFWEPVFWGIVPSLYLRWNSRAYKGSKLDSQQIRILEVLPGNPSDRLKVTIKSIDLDEAKETGFDALSYSWGGHAILRRIIEANDCLFMVTDTAFRALKTLRNSTEKRYIWIDSICINQADKEEKKSQVGKFMAFIYRDAQNVIVWLGEGPAHLGDAFDIVRQVACANPDEIDSICSKSNKWQKPLHDLLRRRWWSRVWIVQEVALGHNIVVRSGQHELPWDTLSRFLQSSQRVPGLKVDQKILDFVLQISVLKSSQADPEHGLLALALRFRNRVAADPRDKLYGLRALLHSTTSETIDADYTKSSPRVFTAFAASYIDRDISVMALAESRHTLGCSWAVDWGKMTSPEWANFYPLIGIETTRENFNMFWNGGLLPSIIANQRKYSATKNLEAECTVGRKGWNSLKVTGWQEDIIEAVGEVCKGEYIDEVMTWEEVESIIKSWEKLACRYVTNFTPEKHASFDRTIVADAWQETQPVAIDFPEQSGNGALIPSSSVPELSPAPKASQEDDIEAQNSAPRSGRRTNDNVKPVTKQQFTATCCF